MSDNFLAGLLVGLFIGGFIGTLAVALVAAGSEQRFPRALGEVAWAAGAASLSGETETESSMHVDLLPDLREVPRYEDTGRGSMPWSASPSEDPDR